MAKDTQSIAGMRFQKYDTGVVHVHDDARNLKFTAKTGEFKKSVLDFVKEKDDGAIILDGTSKEKLLLAKEGKKITAVILPEQGMAKDLLSFVHTL